LTSALDGGEWSASRPGHLTPRKEPLVPVRRLGGPQSRSGRCGEEKNSQPSPGIEPKNPNRPARSPALYRLSYHGSNHWQLISIVHFAGGFFFCYLNNFTLRRMYIGAKLRFWNWSSKSVDISAICLLLPLMLLQMDIFNLACDWWSVIRWKHASHILILKYAGGGAVWLPVPFCRQFDTRLQLPVLGCIVARNQEIFETRVTTVWAAVAGGEWHVGIFRARALLWQSQPLQF
jgi:hypothetical protein